LQARLLLQVQDELRKFEAQLDAMDKGPLCWLVSPYSSGRWTTTTCQAEERSDAEGSGLGGVLDADAADGDAD